MTKESQNTSDVSNDTIEESEKQAVENFKVDDIIDSHVDKEPSPSEHFIEKEKEKQEAFEQQVKNNEITDKRNTVFNPAIHENDGAGKPSLTKAGYFRKKRGVRKNDLNLPKEENVQDKAGSIACGKLSANVLITAGIALGGDEWNPQKSVEHGLDEKLMLEKAFADYFEATGKTDLPPSLALCVAVGAYALPRFTMPKTKTRLQTFKEWLGSKVGKWKMRKKDKNVAEKQQEDKKETKEENKNGS